MSLGRWNSNFSQIPLILGFFFNHLCVTICSRDPQWVLMKAYFQYISEKVYKNCLAGQIQKLKTFNEKKVLWTDFYMVKWWWTYLFIVFVTLLWLIFSCRPVTARAARKVPPLGVVLPSMSECTLYFWSIFLTISLTMLEWRQRYRYWFKATWRWLSRVSVSFHIGSCFSYSANSRTRPA